MNGVACLRSEIIIFKVFRSCYTMIQLEEYFNVSSKYLCEELKEFFHNTPNLFNEVMEQIKLNEEQKSLEKQSCDDGFER